jgi:5-methylcytosine-specific restriction endonuclease McrA
LEANVCLHCGISDPLNVSLKRWKRLKRQKAKEKRERKKEEKLVEFDGHDVKYYRVSSKERYQEYQRTPWWKKRREQFLKKHGNKCSVCGSRENIVVHHLTYIRLGNESDKDLQVLCRDCHHKYHEKFGVPVRQQVLKKMERDHLEACAAGY